MGKLPDDWVEANVAPVFKKGDQHSPTNYRPISLTCVCAKLLKHIICKQIMSHFLKNKIFTPVQHGFRSKHSCESQLLITTDEFIQNFEGKTQTDVVVLDFSKALDVVPHQRLLHKLDHYRLQGTTLNWIQNWADQEKLQRDLFALQDWADRWGMCFNPSKCSVLRVSRPK